MPDTNDRPLCAITGTGGYLGGCVQRHFEQQGWTVLELTRKPRPGLRAAAFQLGAAVEPRTLAGVKALVHCAYDFRALRWEEIHATNVGGTEKLLQAARAAGVAKVACVSSISAFAGCRSLYGKAKLEIERVAGAQGALAIRPGLIYGDPPGAMFGRLVKQVSHASVLPLFGGGHQTQFLVHCEDLCGFLHRFASGQVTLATLLLTAAHEQPWTFRQILEAIARAKGRRLTFVPVPWWGVWAALKTAETCGAPLGFRSDSLISLMNQNPQPDFSPNAAAGLVCRRFSLEGLRL